MKHDLQDHPIPANASPEFGHAEKKFYAAKTDEERLSALEEMIRTMPQHKSAEAMRANLRTRYKKLQEKLETKKKKGKSGGKEGIKKGDLQIVLIGLTNSGKSSVLSALTNAKPGISQVEYQTKTAMLGTLDYTGVKVQIVDLPSIESEYFDSGISNTADSLMVIITNPKELGKIAPLIEKSIGERIIVLNKIDLLLESERRRMTSQLQSKKFNFISFSAKTKENINELKQKIWESFHKIRVYTKQPGKAQDIDPVIMNPNSTLKDVAEKIFHGLFSRVKETRVTGPSSKFPNQKVGLDHVLKDKDIVEFRT